MPTREDNGNNEPDYDDEEDQLEEE